MRNYIFSAFILSLVIFCGTAWGMQPYLQSLCQDAKYTCIKTHKGETWESLFADPELRDIVMRLNRVNIEPRAGQVIVVPNNMLTIKLMDLSPFKQEIPAPGKKTIIFDPKIHAWGAYNENGQLVKWGPASGGRDWCPDIGSRCHTVTGEFTIYRKSGAQCVSSIFPLHEGGAPTPYCMFFYRGYALHASKEVPGYNASHGCIRLFLEDARWLNQEFIALPQAGGTKVIVQDYPQSA